MAQALTSRLSRLFISTPTALSLPVTSTISPKLAHFFGFRGVHLPGSVVRSLSSSTSIAPLQKNEKKKADWGATSSIGPLMSQDKAEQFAAFTHVNRREKVRPFIVKRRINQLKTYIGGERNIRHSPWRMNLVCQFAAGMTVPEALKQLMFLQKVKAPLVAKVIRRTSNLADIRHGIQPSQLEVAECFATHGTHLKRLKIMGRGRSGKKLRRHCHIRLVLREIDFPLKLLQAESLNQKRRWLGRLGIAREDFEKAKAGKDELAELEAKAAQIEAEAKKKEEEEKDK